MVGRRTDGPPRSTLLQRQIAWPDRVGRVLVGDELAHPVERHTGLLAPRQHAPDHPRQEAEPAEVRDEQRQRADVECTGRDGARR